MGDWQELGVGVKNRNDFIIPGHSTHRYRLLKREGLRKG